MKYLYCIVIFCFLGCTCKKGEIPEGSICPEYGSSIGRHFTWDEADSVKQKAAYFLLSQINSYTCNSAGQTVSETIPPAFLIRHIESKVGQYLFLAEGNDFRNFFRVFTSLSGGR